jgi:hypothetical protein
VALAREHLGPDPRLRRRAGSDRAPFFNRLGCSAKFVVTAF